MNSRSSFVHSPRRRNAAASMARGPAPIIGRSTDLARRGRSRRCPKPCSGPSAVRWRAVRMRRLHTQNISLAISKTSLPTPPLGWCQAWA